MVKLLWIATLVLLALGLSPTTEANNKQRGLTHTSCSISQDILSIRGGDVSDEGSEYDEDEEESEDDEKFDSALAASAVKSVSKTKTKEAIEKKETVKKAFNAKLASAPAKKKSKSLAKKLHIPYIIRACFNPFTVFAMTKAYWASLFNLNFLKKEQSQELRSALEEKAKKGGTGPSGGRGKRKMKRGQAKTLSDLPQLST